MGRRDARTPRFRYLRAAVHEEMRGEGKWEGMAAFLCSPLNTWFVAEFWRFGLYAMALSEGSGSAVLNEGGYILELVDGADKRGRVVRVWCSPTINIQLAKGRSCQRP